MIRRVEVEEARSRVEGLGVGEWGEPELLCRIIAELIIMMAGCSIIFSTIHNQTQHTTDNNQNPGGYCIERTPAEKDQPQLTKQT